MQYTKRHCKNYLRDHWLQASVVLITVAACTLMFFFNGSSSIPLNDAFHSDLRGYLRNVYSALHTEYGSIDRFREELAQLLRRQAQGELAPAEGDTATVSFWDMHFWSDMAIPASSKPFNSHEIELLKEVVGSAMGQAQGLRRDIDVRKRAVVGLFRTKRASFRVLFVPCVLAGAGDNMLDIASDAPGKALLVLVPLAVTTDGPNAEFLASPYLSEVKHGFFSSAMVKEAIQWAGLPSSHVLLSDGRPYAVSM